MRKQARIDEFEICVRDTVSMYWFGFLTDLIRGVVMYSTLYDIIVNTQGLGQVSFDLEAVCSLPRHACMQQCDKKTEAGRYAW